MFNKRARAWKYAEIKETPAAGPRTVEQMKHASVKAQACPYIFCHQCWKYWNRLSTLGDNKCDTTRQTMYVLCNSEGPSRVIVAVEKQQELLIDLCVRACMLVAYRMGVCMRMNACSLANLAWNAYAPYCDVVCDLSLSTIFFGIISNGATFGKKLLNIKCVFSFSPQHSKSYSILRRI